MAELVAEDKDNEMRAHKDKESQWSSEKLAAQSEQLMLQEKEIENLKEELNLCRLTIVSMETESTTERKRLREELLSYVQKCRQLEDTKRELEENIGLYKEQNRVLHLNHQQLEAKCLELEEDLGRADKQNDSIDQIRKDNASLKTQVLLLTELYQQLKDRFAAVNKNATSEEIIAFETELKNREITELKVKLDNISHLMEAFKAKNSEIESQMAKKEMIITEQKNIIETNKIWHKKQLQVERQRISALKNVIQNLELHILSLYGRLGLEQQEQTLRQKLGLIQEFASNEDMISNIMDSESDNQNNSNEL